MYVRVTELPTLSHTHLVSKTGLLAATVAVSIIESYKLLSPDTGSAAALLQNQISQQLSALSDGAQIPSPSLYSDLSFRPTSSIHINILWFLSLTLNLICAHAVTLMQQWARRYLQLMQAQTTLHKCARTRECLFEGVQAKLFELVNVPWPKDSIYLLARCLLLVLHSFISALLPHLSSDDIQPTTFCAVREALLRILNEAPQGDNNPEPHIRLIPGHLG